MENAVFSREDIVHRPTGRKSDIHPQTGEPLASAFIRRQKPKDEKGISIAHSCTPENAAPWLKTRLAVFSLTVGDIRDLTGKVRTIHQIDAVPDTDDNGRVNGTHGNIVGTPYREDDRALAERLGELLARIAVPTWPPKEQQVEQ